MIEKFKGFVRLSEEQYQTLKKNGSITEGDTTINYEPETTIYVTPDTTEAEIVQLKTDVASKQAQLIAGDNVTIDENNTISAKGFDLNQLPKFKNMFKIDMSKTPDLTGLFTANIVSSSNFYVDWGDNTSTYYEEAATKISHQYNDPSFIGMVVIYGDWKGLVTNNKKNLIEVYYDVNITSLPDRAFYYCTNLKVLQLPDTVKSIGYESVAYCSSLEIMNLPSNLKSIGGSGIVGCSKLYISNLPESLTSIGTGVFRLCYLPEKIFLPNITQLDSRFSEANNGDKTMELYTRATNISERGLLHSNSTFKNVVKNIITTNGVASLRLATSSYEQINKDSLVFVLSKNLANYKKATNWVARADFIYPIGGQYSETVTIPVSSWVENSATVEVVGSTSETRNVIEFMLVDAGGNQIEDTYGLKATQGTTQMTFTCATVPTEDISLFIKSTLTNY